MGSRSYTWATALIGLTIAAALSLWVAFIGLIVGPDAVRERTGITIGGIVIVYCAGGLVAGMIVGLMLPLGRRLWGAILIGYVSSLPVYGALLYAAALRLRAPPGKVIMLTVVGMLLTGVVGAALGAKLWLDRHSAPRTRARLARVTEGRSMVVGGSIGAILGTLWHVGHLTGGTSLGGAVLGGTAVGVALGRAWWAATRRY